MQSSRCGDAHRGAMMCSEPFLMLICIFLPYWANIPTHWVRANSLTHQQWWSARHFRYEAGLVSSAMGTFMFICIEFHLHPIAQAPLKSLCNAYQLSLVLFTLPNLQSSANCKIPFSRTFMSTANCRGHNWEVSPLQEVHCSFTNTPSEKTLTAGCWQEYVVPEASSSLFKRHLLSLCALTCIKIRSEQLKI